MKRTALVHATMAGLEGLEDLPLGEQIALLGEAQTVLAGVLNNDPGLNQPGIPGVSR
ncbi:hypothetical protein [Tessaracoccus sp. G1721]